MKSTDIVVKAVRLYFLGVQTRVPLKFGTETLTSVTCVRVCLTVEDRNGRDAQGWGETPLSVQWAWPSSLDYTYRHNAMKEFCRSLAMAWVDFSQTGHCVEIGYNFLESRLSDILKRLNESKYLRAYARSIAVTGFACPPYGG